MEQNIFIIDTIIVVAFAVAANIVKINADKFIINWWQGILVKLKLIMSDANFIIILELKYNKLVSSTNLIVRFTFFFPKIKIFLFIKFQFC